MSWATRPVAAGRPALCAAVRGSGPLTAHSELGEGDLDRLVEQPHRLRIATVEIWMAVLGQSPTGGADVVGVGIVRQSQQA